MIIVDAHEDIAWNMVAFGRDYLAENTAATGERGLLGWPDWVHGRVAVVFSTLFASKLGKRSSSAYGYRNMTEAHLLYRQQLQVYHDLVAHHPDKFCLITHAETLAHVLTRWEQADPIVGLVVLMEGAEGIQHPDELTWWYEQGLRIIGPAWSQTRYAGGTDAPGPFTPLGFELLRRMADLNMILDLSHLSDEGVATALTEYTGPIIASHSNPRALLPRSSSPERHLSDETILQLAQRGGVMGIVLATPFLDDSVSWSDTRRQVTLDQVIVHIDYCCQLIGDARHVGIGSDFDGGFGVELVPQGLDSIADLERIAEALFHYGYAEADIEAIMGANWLNFLFQHL